ncbi:MAG: adenosine deaminase family protein [Verrucomicrobia bacterium]|nr:MAG: adenosine deaminase family protein [Verrucomicrobiota bacterium]
MPYAPDPSLAAFIQSLPKTETHLHIEGALPLELLRRVAPDKFPDTTPPWWADDYRYADFPTFEKILIDHALLWFTSPERYHEAARVIFEGLAKQNVRYVETSFHLPVTQFIHADGEAIVEAIRTAAPEGMIVRVFVGMLRTDYTPELAPVIDRLGEWKHLAGVDLHGVETWALQPWTARVWRRIREAGKETKAHAGEFGGAANVREAVEVLGVHRVQHGVRSIEDPQVVELLRQNNITCDVCPISNVKLAVVPSMREHPIRQLFDAGIRCTVSTDDPFSFGNTLSEEYAALAMDLGFTRRELVRIARNGFEVALVDEATRAGFLDELARIEAALE